MARCGDVFWNYLHCGAAMARISSQNVLYHLLQFMIQFQPSRRNSAGVDGAVVFDFDVGGMVRVGGGRWAGHGVIVHGKMRVESASTL